MNSHSAWSIEDKPSKEQLLNMIKYTNHVLNTIIFIQLILRR